MINALLQKSPNKVEFKEFYHEYVSRVSKNITSIFGGYQPKRRGPHMGLKLLKIEAHPLSYGLIQMGVLSKKQIHFSDPQDK